MNPGHPNVYQVRKRFGNLFSSGKFLGKAPNRTCEIIAASFEADFPYILGEPNQAYLKKEQDWYYSESLNVNDMPDPPEIWKRVATPEGFINSNYGYLVFSPGNGNQYHNVLKELVRDPTSRRAVMIYTRPTMHVDQRRGGMQDFVCTNTVQYFIRDGQLMAHVCMRSNDAWAGYRNDYHWQHHIHQRLAMDLGIEPGELWWTVGSLHFYERQFYLLDYFVETGKFSCTRDQYDELRSDSPWAWWRKKDG